MWKVRDFFSSKGTFFNETQCSVFSFIAGWILALKPSPEWKHRLAPLHFYLFPFQSIGYILADTSAQMFQSLFWRLCRCFWQAGWPCKTLSRIFHFAENVKCRQISLELISWGPHSSLARKEISYSLVYVLH